MTSRKPAEHDTGRKLYILDIENMQGNFDGHVTEGEVAHIRRELMRALPMGDADQAVIGTSCPRNLLAAGTWKGARQVFRGGHDGADLALLDVLNEEDVEDRFSCVVLGSGDHIFTEAVNRLVALGCDVLLLDTGTPASRILRDSATGIIRLEHGLANPAIGRGLTVAA